ncbi:alpha/beta hydrolase [uncultured Eudoraea sp.]|uniref:alpha/beta fold hydrolase n=1 Tax=uncultured Eudoraea sp. TaxID=1035614 RepID=UPI00261F25C2|nr:alpha/beta hydrolase [uncultured Eudoraea sp.]
MKKLLTNIFAKAYGVYFNILALFSKKLAGEKAITLFSSPRKGNVLPIQASFLKEAEDIRIEVGGKKIQTYSWTGTKEPVLLLHGWESNSFRWRNLIRFLSNANFTIVAFDAPAHGNSSGGIFNVPLYAECTQHIVKHFNPSYIIGHSVGGMTAVYHQYIYPHNSIQKIVTIGAPSEFYELMEHYQNIVGFNKRVLASIEDYIQKHFGYGIQDFSSSKFVQKIQTEGLLVHDIEDPITPYHNSEKVHASWKNSRLISTRGLGHSMHQDKVNNQIIDFLKSKKRANFSA